MSLTDKLISDFMALGDVNRKDVVISVQVYLELSEIKKYWDVKCKYNPDLKLLYISAKKTKSENPTVFVPRSLSQELNFHNMYRYFELCEDCDIRRVFLALVATDSTCVYYQLSDGLCEPKDLKSKQSKDSRQEKLDLDIKKHRTLIEHSALCGIPITIKESKGEQK